MVSPFFLFYNDQMILTDKQVISNPALLKDPKVLQNFEAYDPSGKKLLVKREAETLILVEDAGESTRAARNPERAQADAERFRKKILAFWESSGNPVPGIGKMNLEQAVQASLDWLKAAEWKTYRRGSKLFWTMMLPCGLIPFIIGLFRIPWDTIPSRNGSLAIYIGCFLAAMALIGWLHRKLYAKPPFPEPQQ